MNRKPSTAWFLASAALALAVFSPLLGGAFEDELGTDDAKIRDKVKRDPSKGKGADSGRGPAPYLPALGAPPKRVALASFYVWDCGNVKDHSYMGWKSTKNITASGIEAFAIEFYDASIESFKQSFKAHGMELLTPSEFLDSAEKRQAYESFEIKYGAFGKITGGGRKMTADASRFTAAPEGYKVLEMPIINDAKERNFSITSDGKLAQNLGHDLTAALGVDAVVVVYNVLQMQGKTFEMLGSYMYMYGPNPVKRDDDPSLYWTGHQYSSAFLKLSVPFARHKGKEAEVDFAGYARVASALSERTGQYLEQRISGKEKEE